MHKGELAFFGAISVTMAALAISFINPVPIIVAFFAVLAYTKLRRKK